MIYSEIIFNKSAREKLLKGVNTIADAVGSTLSPRGQNVAIQKTTPQGDVYDRTVLHDGVSVARSIELEDPFENMGAQILKEAAQKQVDAVGDGTTVVMILAQALVNECLQLIETGVSPRMLREGLERGSERLIKKLKSLSRPINGYEDMKRIATISAQDEQLGELVARTLEKVGKDGVITIEESKNHETTTEHQEGMQLDRGYIHQLMVTNPETMEAIWENSYVLVTDKPIMNLSEMDKFLNAFVKESKWLTIFAPTIEGEALALLMQNKLRGTLFTLGIKIIGVGQVQKDTLQDIAIMTGAHFITEDAADKWEDVTVNDLGFAEYITATKSESIIVGGKGKKEQIQERITSIKNQLETETGDFEREKLKERLAKFTNGVAVIKVGGFTEIEMKDRRESALDAKAATIAAMETGVVAGGETVYLHIRKSLGKSLPDRILYKALYAPFKKLLSNANLDEVETALALQGKDNNFGVDVLDGKVKDMFEAGIVDPVAVPLHAIRNAVSVALELITTGTIVVQKVQEKK